MPCFALQRTSSTGTWWRFGGRPLTAGCCQAQPHQYQPSMPALPCRCCSQPRLGLKQQPRRPAEQFKLCGSSSVGCERHHVTIAAVGLGRQASPAQLLQPLFYQHHSAQWHSCVSDELPYSPSQFLLLQHYLFILGSILSYSCFQEASFCSAG